MSRYIDADALHDALKAKQLWVVRCGDKHNEGYTYDQVHFAIDEAPSIDIVPKRGEWITIDTKVVSVPVYWNEEQRQSDERGAGIQEKCKCSVCGWRTNFVGYKKLGVNKSFNYCPNCGADMREREGE